MFKTWAIFIFLLTWLLAGTQARCQTNQQDSLALVDLYDSLNGLTWIVNSNWKAPFPTTVDMWYGVTVTGNRVTGISLSGNGMTGTLPSSIGNLSALTLLVLSGNQLSGKIPPQLGNLMQLQYLNIGGNNLTGGIPATLGNLINLQNLDLSNNKLSGPIPSGIGNFTGLISLDLSNNALTGPLPAGIFGLSNLVGLSLNNNQISDTLNNSIYGLQALESMNLSFNQLKGPLPDSLFALPVSQLILSHNQFTGELSTRVGNLVNLGSLDLSFNQIACRIPASLANLSSLSNILLNNNRFDDMDPLTNLFVNSSLTMDVSNNLLQFADIEGNLPLNGFSYSPQDSLFWPIIVHLTEGDQLYKSQPVEGSSNTYQWYKDGILLPDNGPDLNRLIVTIADAGRYVLQIQSGVVTGLTLYRRAIIVTVSSCSANVTAKESSALVAIYNALDGPHWANHSGWSSSPLSGDVNSSWYGVTTRCGHVVFLTLPFNNLNGSLPAEIGDLIYLESLDLSSNRSLTSVPNEMGNLSNLRRLELSNDSLTTSFPSWVTNLTSLTYLNFGNNFLKGTIPESISDLGELESWYSDNNQITGPIPASVCQMENLNQFRLNNNRLSGSIPTGVGELLKLTELSLNNNKLTGFIPSSLNNPILLQYMDLSSNLLSGAIPDLSNLTTLVNLGLGANQLTGDFPPFITTLDSLTNLNLNANQLTGTLPPNLSSLTNPNLANFSVADNQFTGPIPASVGSLKKLNTFDVRYNKLNGPIPSSMGSMDSLTFLGLSFNSLGLASDLLAPGIYTIPPELGNLTKLKYFYLDHNSLSGPIPAELGQLGNITDFWLNQNELTGPIPPEIGNDTKIGWMDLSNNLLSGPIPKEFGNLTNLSVLFLNDNHYLTGPLPPELGNCTNLGDLVVNGNQLTGAIPSTYSNFTKLFWLDLSANLFTDSIPSYLSKNTGLNYFFIANNKFKYVPDFTTVMPQLVGVSLSNNALTFESIEPYYKVKSRWSLAFDYSPQDSTGVKKSLSLRAGCPQAYTANVGGANNLYQWYKNGIAMAGQNNSTLSFSPMSATDAGDYSCAVTNSLVTTPPLTINTRPITISVLPAVNTTLGEDPNNQLCNARNLIASPSGLFAYQWYLDGKKMVGAQKDTLTAYYDGDYTVTYQPDPTSCSLITPVLAVAGLYSDSQPQVTSSGSPITQLATQYTADSYQWYVNGKVIAGATLDSLHIWYNGSYYVVAKLTNNCQYKSNSLVVNESKYNNLSRLGDVMSDSIVLKAPDEMVLVYPNPTQDLVTIDPGPFVATGVEFFDMTDKSVYKRESGVPFQSIQVDVSKWNTGVYLISIGSDEKRIWRKLVKY